MDNRFTVSIGNKPSPTESQFSSNARTGTGTGTHLGMVTYCRRQTPLGIYSVLI